MGGLYSNYENIWTWLAFSHSADLSLGVFRGLCANFIDQNKLWLLFTLVSIAEALRTELFNKSQMLGIGGVKGCV